MIEHQKYSFKKGQSVCLDSVYNILGLIPQDCYKQDDPADARPFSQNCNNDSGETLKFKKDVIIEIRVKCS